MHHPNDVLVVPSSPGSGSGQLIQDVIDRSFQIDCHSTIYIPCGRWILTKPLRLYPPSSTFDYTKNLSFSVHLTGARPAYGGQGGDKYFTILECQFDTKDQPAIDIQACRGTTISNLSLEGHNRALKQDLPEGFGKLKENDIWLKDGVKEEHAAIAIDSHAGLGSGMILIDNVSAEYFGSGITIGTSGHPLTQNGENILIRRFFGQYLGRAGIVIGQAQTKGIKITDSYFHGQQYWIDSVNKGQQQGFPPVISGCIIGATQRLFNLHHGFGNFACHGLYVESTLSLGTIGYGGSSQNLPAVFTGCEFSLYQENIHEGVDTHLLNGRPVLFQACIFQFNRDIDAGKPGEAAYVPAHRTCFKAHNLRQLVFDTCTFAWSSANGELPVAVHHAPYVSYRNCTYQSANTVFIDGQAEMEAELINMVILRKDHPGACVTFDLQGTTIDLQVGDCIGYDNTSADPDTYWYPQVDIDGLTQANSPRTKVPFATVGKIEGKTVTLHQMSRTIYRAIKKKKKVTIYRLRPGVI